MDQVGGIEDIDIIDSTTAPFEKVMVVVSQRKPIFISIISPHPLLRQSFGHLLAGMGGFHVAGYSEIKDDEGETGTGEENDLALIIASQNEALETTRILLKGDATQKVALLCWDWTVERVQDALSAGATGVLSMDISVQELALDLRQIARGEVTLSSSLQRAIISQFLKGETSETAPPPYENLSPREHEVLSLVTEGSNNKQIAQHLYLSVRTVENHLARIYDKLGVRTRTEAAVLAIQQGWITPN